MSTTRREMLVQIALGVSAAAAPAAAQQSSNAHAGHAHGAAAAAAHTGAGAAKVFNAHEFKTLQVLSDWIIPPDERSQGGIAAGTAEFLDVIAATDPKLQFAFTGGIAWLDDQMRARHNKTFLECSRAQQKECLDSIAYRDKAPKELAPGVEFFALMRGWTVDAFYSSKVGIEDVGYIGNTA
ncbi:MAG TPA: gluconate 2-dehydrogenase subunit 3 family protein, partial [Bryobacterales bacterium]|nr:gluconate 2-dehydrogenase subunit 3 family protein [Bryobacterales bacterium]